MSVSDEFSFSVVRNKIVVLIQFSGRLLPSQLSKLEECKIQIQEDSETRFVVLDMRNVLDIPMGQFPQFAKFQKNIRTDGVEIKLCGLTEELKTRMLRAGIVRNTELASNLPEAIRKIQESQAATVSESSGEIETKKAA